jgi:hypothetical protein
MPTIGLSSVVGRDSVEPKRSGQTGGSTGVSPYRTRQKIRAIRAIRGYQTSMRRDDPRINHSDFQPIAECVHSEQMARLGRSVLDLLPQLHDQLIEGARGAVILDAPDFVQERVARNHVAAFAK